MSYQLALEYRANFVIWVFVDIGWGFIDLVFFGALASTINTIGRWSLGEVFVVVGLYRLFSIPLWSWMYACFSKLPEMISEGKLDLILTKPIDSQFTVSVRHISFNMLSSVVIGFFYIVTGLKLYGYSPSVINIIQSMWLFLIATIMIYAVYFMTVAIGLFFDRINNLHNLFPNFFHAARYPPEIYAPILQRILTTILPLALMVFVPAEAIFGRPNWLTIVWFHLLTIFFLIFSRFIWNTGLRRYSSASS